MVDSVTISDAGAHAAFALTDRIPASKGPFTPGTRGYLEGTVIKTLLDTFYQPLDADLTALAALTTATFGRSLLTTVDAAALAGLVDSFFLTPTEGNVAYQPLDSDLTTLAANITTFGHSLVDDANAAAGRATLGVTASGADTTYAFRANNLSDLANASTARTNLGLGTAAVKNTGTSGNTVPLLDGANTWGAAQTFPGSGIWNGSGNVGIGTTSPTFSAGGGLQIEHALQAVLKLQGMAGATKWELSANGAFYFFDAAVGLERLRILDGGGEAIWNNSGADADFRIKGDTDASVFFVDASTDRIGIGTDTPRSKFSVFQDSNTGWNGRGIFSGAANAAMIGTYEGVATIGAHTAALSAWADLQLNEDGSGRGMIVKSTGNVGIGLMGPAQKLDVAGNIAVSGTKVIGAQGAAVADASGGVVVDIEARAQLNTLLARARTHGLIAT